MPIITSAETKALLQIPTAVTTWDTLIATLIPIVQDKVVEYCNHRFINIDVQIEGTTIAFVTGAPATITDSESGFSDALFSSGDDISVRGSYRNDGIYATQTVAAGLVTLATGETLVSETQDTPHSIMITRVVWPKAMKPEVALAIRYLINKQGKTVNSESLPGGYSAQYQV